MKMQSQSELYRSFRQQCPYLSALAAWRQAGEVAETNRWAAAVEFDWQGQFEPRYARWTEAGYQLVARLPVDEDGWDMVGADMLGRFTNRWKPSAIAHEHGNNRTFDWFIPEDAAMGQWDYRRACSFGRDWDYRVLVVTAYRNDVELASTSLCGIESDSDESYLTGMAFDLKLEVIDMADSKLRELCGCH